MSPDRKKIAFIGSRGIPANYGGFETFLEEVSKTIQQNANFQIIVVSDLEQKIKLKGLKNYFGIKILYSKYSKSKNPLLFNFDSMRKVWNADIIYCCGVGNAFSVFLPFLFRKKYITNPDGIGWKRLKYSSFGRTILKVMFMITSAFSPYIICDSKEIEKILRKKFFRKKNITTIEYGAHINKTVHLQNSVTRSILEKYNLTSMKYHLVVSRLEPENNIDTIIIGYSKNTRKFPLIIVGNISQTKYVRNLTDLQNKEVTFVGGIYDSNELNVIRSNAYSYIHGHSVGGTNPSLLEAMASKNLCVCHENEFNKGLVGKDGFYFKTSTEISSIFEKIEESNLDAMRGRVYEKIRDYYNWENITNLYISYFQKISK